MESLLNTVTLTVLLATVLLWVLYRKRKMAFFKNLGVPGPEPHFIFGNLNEYIEKGPTKCQVDWVKHYGRIMGYFLGGEPFLLIAEPELLKTVLIKDFQYFSDRAAFMPGDIFPVKTLGNRIVRLQGKRWKEVRGIMTPSFSAGKMKQMVPIMDDAIRVLLEKMKVAAESKEEVDVWSLFQGVSMDIIARTAFGVHTDVQRNRNDPFLINAQKLLTITPSALLSKIAFWFPELVPVTLSVRKLVEVIDHFRQKAPASGLLDLCTDIINLRRSKSNERRPDLLQLMLDANMSQQDLMTVTDQQLTATLEPDISASQTMTTGIATGERRKLHYMTDDEIKANSVFFMSTGYETISSMLAFTAHLLAHHPKVQGRLHEEIKAVTSEEGDLDYNTLSKLAYLDQVVNESLRLYPPIFGVVTRKAAVDYQLGSLLLPKGTNILVPLWQLQHDPEYWPDPYNFDPDRFSSENKPFIDPMTFQPFGAGPRNCVGMRFALMEAKLILARVMKEFQFITSKRTEQGEVSLSVQLINIRPKNPVYLKIILA